MSRSTTLVADLTARVRWHWPFLVVLALAAVLRAVVWSAVRPAWWILLDGIAYLAEAMHLVPDIWRPSGYSLMMLRPLWFAHHLSLVTSAQHLMGLAVGMLVYLTLLRFGLSRWVATAGSVPALFDAYVVATEQMIGADALFGFLVTCSLALLLWPLGRRWRLAAAAAAGGLLGLSAITRSVGLPLVAVAVLFLLLPRPAWSRLVALCVAFALPVGVYALWFSQTYGELNLTATTGFYMYGETSLFVDCTKVHFSDPQLRQLCPTGAINRSDALRTYAFYVFDGSSPVHRNRLSLLASNRQAGRFAEEAILAQPGDYARLVWTGLVDTFEWDQASLQDDMDFAYVQSLPAEARAVGVAYQDGRDPGPFYHKELVRPLVAYQAIAHVPGPACLAALLLAALALVFGRDPDRRGLRAAVVLTAGTALVVLLVPPFTTIVAPRYRVPAIPALCLTVAISGGLLANTWRVHRPAAHAQPAGRASARTQHALPRQ